jgi:hypothetical protein
MHQSGVNEPGGWWAYARRILLARKKNAVSFASRRAGSHSRCVDRLPLHILQETARVATRDSLSHWGALCELDKLTLSTFWKDEFVIFQLCLAAECATDALVLTEATINAQTGDLVSVCVFQDTLENLGVYPIDAINSTN